jgi:hypothetical protein
MRLLDRIALQRLISALLGFILVIVKMVVPHPVEVDDEEEDTPKPKPRKRKRIFPKILP